MAEHNYSEPVQKLLALGQPIDPWPDYLAMDLDQRHIPELIEMVQDESLLNQVHDPEEFPPEGYASVHAWRALGQMKAEEAIPALIGVLHQSDDLDDEWADEELPHVFEMIGSACTPALAAALADPARQLYARWLACTSLAHIALSYPEQRTACLEAMAATLQGFEQNDEALNAAIISDMVDLKAVEHLPLIEQAFKADKVDEMVMGDFEDVQVELGLLEERLTPFHPYWVASPTPSPRTTTRKVNKKEKAKRKQEKKSRKKNRKKK